jgi:hypothetical protein
MAGLAVACLSVAALAACSGLTESTDLSAVGKACTKAVDKAITGMGDQYAGRDFVEISEDGESVSVSSPVNGENGAIVAGLALGCILQKTRAPSTVEARLQRMTPVDGRREAYWSDLTMTYSLDLDRGLTAVVTSD